MMLSLSKALFGRSLGRILFRQTFLHCECKLPLSFMRSGSGPGAANFFDCRLTFDILISNLLPSYLRSKGGR